MNVDEATNKLREACIAARAATKAVNAARGACERAEKASFEAYRTQEESHKAFIVALLGEDVYAASDRAPE